jgi:hypothetical protein
MMQAGQACRGDFQIVSTPDSEDIDRIRVPTRLSMRSMKSLTDEKVNIGQVLGC